MNVTDDTLLTLRLAISALSFLPPTEMQALMRAKAALDGTDLEITRPLTCLEDFTEEEANAASLRLEMQALSKRVALRRERRMGRYARYGGRA